MTENKQYNYTGDFYKKKNPLRNKCIKGVQKLQDGKDEKKLKQIKDIIFAS